MERDNPPISSKKFEEIRAEALEELNIEVQDDNPYLALKEYIACDRAYQQGFKIGRRKGRLLVRKYIEEVRAEQKEIVQRKLVLFDTIIGHLNEYLPVSYEKFCGDWGLQKIIERALQILIEIMIDIPKRLIIRKGDAPLQDSADAFRKLREYGVIQEDEIYIRIVKLRDHLLYEYDSLDLSIIWETACEHLSDFERFKNELFSAKNSW